MRLTIDRRILSRPVPIRNSRRVIGRERPAARESSAQGQSAVILARMPSYRQVLSLLLAIAALAGCASAPATSPPPAAERSITILTMNDVYRIEGLEGGALGGLARLRALRAQLEAEAPGRVLLLHGGDAISPSLLSRQYHGEQMIDVMNLLDGDPTPGRLDERMFVVFGNHEFDQEACGAPKHLQARVTQSDFYWLGANVVPPRCRDGAPRLAASNVLAGTLIDVGGIRVGLFGLTVPSSSRDVGFLDPLATATALTADLRRRGAEVVIGVTHLTKEEDQRIYAALRDRGLDLIVGGHEHEHMALPPGDAPRIFKADADAATAWVITLTVGADRRVRVRATLRSLDATIAKDPAVAARVDQWLARHEREFCAADHQAPTCLSAPIATSATPLIAEEEKIRGQETSVGNWVTGLMLEAFAPCGAEAAIINAGGLRLNHDLPAGVAITRRHVEELMQFRTPLYLLDVTGAQLRRTVENAISEPGGGRFLQVSGLAFVFDPTTTPPRLTTLYVAPGPGRLPIDVLTHPDQHFRIVVNEYLPRGVEDAYAGILPPISEALACSATGTDLKQLIFTTLAAQGRIAPTTEGRICTVAEARAGRACLAEIWAAR